MVRLRPPEERTIPIRRMENEMEMDPKGMAFACKDDVMLARRDVVDVL